MRAHHPPQQSEQAECTPAIAVPASGSCGGTLPFAKVAHYQLQNGAGVGAPMPYIPLAPIGRINRPTKAAWPVEPVVTPPVAVVAPPPAKAYRPAADIAEARSVPKQQAAPSARRLPSNDQRDAPNGASTSGARARSSSSDSSRAATSGSSSRCKGSQKVACDTVLGASGIGTYSGRRFSDPSVAQPRCKLANGTASNQARSGSAMAAAALASSITSPQIGRRSRGSNEIGAVYSGVTNGAASSSTASPKGQGKSGYSVTGVVGQGRSQSRSASPARSADGQQTRPSARSAAMTDTLSSRQRRPLSSGSRGASSDASGMRNTIASSQKTTAASLSRVAAPAGRSTTPRQDRAAAGGGRSTAPGNKAARSPSDNRSRSTTPQPSARPSVSAAIPASARAGSRESGGGVRPRTPQRAVARVMTTASVAARTMNAACAAPQLVRMMPADDTAPVPHPQECRADSSLIESEEYQDSLRTGVSLPLSPSSPPWQPSSPTSPSWPSSGFQACPGYARPVPCVRDGHWRHVEAPPQPWCSACPHPPQQHPSGGSSQALGVRLTDLGPVAALPPPQVHQVHGPLAADNQDVPRDASGYAMEENLPPEVANRHPPWVCSPLSPIREVAEGSGAVTVTLSEDGAVQRCVGVNGDELARVPLGTPYGQICQIIADTRFGKNDVVLLRPDGTLVYRMEVFGPQPEQLQFDDMGYLPNYATLELQAMHEASTAPNGGIRLQASSHNDGEMDKLHQNDNMYIGPDLEPDMIPQTTKDKWLSLREQFISCD